MIKLFSILMFTVFVLNTSSNAQEIISRSFYKSKYGDPIKDSLKAKFVRQTSKLADGTIVSEMINLKSNEVIEKEAYKNNVPSGIWILNDRKLDYSFDLKYDEVYDESIPNIDFVSGTFNGNLKDGFEAPFIGKEKSDLMKFFGQNLNYSRHAIEENIQGRVVAQVEIDENGTMSHLSIFSSVNPELDKETARVILLSGKWIPAKLNGKPVKVVVRIPMTFKIER